MGKEVLLLLFMNKLLCIFLSSLHTPTTTASSARGESEENYEWDDILFSSLGQLLDSLKEI